MFNYNTALLSEGLFFLNFLDAVAEGDGKRIIRQYRYLMLLCKADDPHRTKYAIKSLYQLLLVNGGPSESDAEVFTWNRLVKNHGGLGRNIPFDFGVEHNNNHSKQGIANLDVNVTEKKRRRDVMPCGRILFAIRVAEVWQRRPITLGKYKLTSQLQMSFY